MISRSTFLHLRFPFSIFLLPVYLFALGISNNPGFGNVLLVFLIIHFFLYPASNGYNSYFDKDKGSIGALREPPEVTIELYFVALFLDFVGILLAFLISWQFAIMIFIYGIVSKAYSHPSIRLKRMPFISWFIAGFFQGFFSFLACYIGINDQSYGVFSKPEILYPALLSSSLLWGSYPMTQIYQHEEDQKRGDITLSLILGIKGTFYFTAIFFSISMAGFVLYFYQYFNLYVSISFLIFLAPVLIYFLFWYRKVLKNLEFANFSHTMRLNLISSICLSLFFIWISLETPGL